MKHVHRLKGIKNKRLKLLLIVLMPVMIAVIMVQAIDYSPTSIPATIDFNFNVRPILVQKCYLCHGPDSSGRKADLRLDTFEGATALREEGIRAIVPGHPGKSELVKRITNGDPDMIMPPPKSNFVLSEYEIEVLKKWIEQGAEWKTHWAFIKPELEKPKNFNGQSINQIDDFILEKIEQQGLEPVPLADKHTLIRRVSYILTGLPPTAEMIDKYIADESPEAYEKMVDYYLESGSFGERWARHWMDIVRYAETKGHEFDYAISGAWKYRDYLIRAFNDDIPYDQLVREHLAGDLMDSIRWNTENGINESQIGTAFYTLGEGTHSPVDIRKDEADRIDNMIDVTTKTFQGLTVSCARCHDHKFDPIPTADYYALYGVMESSRFSLRSANLTFEKMENIRDIQTLKDSIRDMIAGRWIDEGIPISENQTTNSGKTEATGRETDHEIIGDFRGHSLNGWRSDGLAFGQKTTLGEPVFDSKGRNLVKFAKGRATSRTLSTGLFGALRSPNFIIDKDFIGIKALGEKATLRIIIDNFQLIQNPIYGGLDKKVNTKKWENFKFDVSAWKGHKAYIEILPGGYKNHIYKLPEDAYVEVEYAITFDNDWPQSIESSDGGKGAVNSQQAILDWAAGKSSPQQVDFLNRRLSRNLHNNHFPKVDQKLERHKKLVRNLGDSSYFMGIYDGFGINSPVFTRGNYKELSDEPIPRGFLSAVSSESIVFLSPGSGRMELAEAILDPDNPLTPRVMVNRIWHHLFGRGIVQTVDNFGLQGKLPSHPKLLDFLAIKFQNDGWSIKKMIKFIVMSNAFRRSVNAEIGTQKIDPDNLLLTHFPIRRLESEAIRDGLLSVAGNLDLSMYGAPVPVHLTQFMHGRGRPDSSGPLDGNGRRSIYLEVRRNFIQPMMLTFDRPIPFSTFGNRNATNVPAQSLILMNDPFVIQQAEIMAKDVTSHNEMSIDEKLEWIYIRTLSRPPSQEEVDKAKAFIHTLAQSFEIKENDISGNLAIWKNYCHSVFNLKEFIYLI